MEIFLSRKLKYFTGLFCGFLISAALSHADVAGEYYYVSSAGDDRNAGTRESPWRTAGHAGREAQAGDTVVFLPGDYTDILEPVNSGVPGAPITFRAAERRQARLIGTDSGSWQEGRGGRIRLDEVEHIRIEGFHIEDTSVDESTGGWLWGNKPRHIDVVDCSFRGGHRWVLFRLTEAEQVRILDSDFARMREGGDMVHINHSDGILVEGNSFTFALHSLVCIRYGTRAVVRGNVFHSGTSRNFENGDNTKTLIENNIFSNAYNGGRSAGPSNSTVGNRSIIRLNRSFHNFGMTWSMSAASTRDTMHNRVYHNVFYGNHGYAWSANSSRGNFRDLIYLNNVFAQNDPYGSGTQIVLRGGGSESVRVVNNVVYAGAPGHDALFRYGRHALGLKQAQSEALSAEEAEAAATHALESGSGTHLPVEAWFRFVQSEEVPAEKRDLVYVGSTDQIARVLEVVADTRTLVLDREVTWEAGDEVGLFVPTGHAGIFERNLEGDPGFADPDRFDFRPADGSLLVDAATPLTITRGGGYGDRLPVGDAYPFFDGFGIEGEQGDVIAVGSPENRARVVRADVDAGILHLDRDLRWEAGAPVALPWAGDAPDIGAFEHGEAARPSVRVAAEEVFVRPGTAVELRAVARGMTPPLEYRWQLGDGSVARGERVSHVYESARDYGVRVRVTDANGESALGVGYVVVEEEAKEPDVLIHSTFNADDDEWWKHWQFYRGRRGTAYAYFRNIIDEETGKGYIRVYPRDPDPAPLPAFIHPRNWDIDEYPFVVIRYRIQPGTPLAVFIRPYPSAHHVLWTLDADQDSRRYYLAGTEGVEGDGTSDVRGRGPLPEGPLPQQLIDDGQWHEVVFDVREIRNRFPDVQILQAMHIGDLEVDGGARVNPRDQFWLDEVYIGKK